MNFMEMNKPPLQTETGFLRETRFLRSDRIFPLCQISHSPSNKRSHCSLNLIDEAQEIETIINQELNYLI